ncbi:MAG: hypothetical protein GX639_09990 [Fibrobacter sp.]|nr:hypothetical protein [Fibrobacter sp.]
MGTRYLRAGVYKWNGSALVCMAAERAGKKDEIAHKIEVMLQSDKSSGKLVTSVVNYPHSQKNNILKFRPRG